jgi:hypothetical protein
MNHRGTSYLKSAVTGMATRPLTPQCMSCLTDVLHCGCMGNLLGARRADGSVSQHCSSRQRREYVRLDTPTGGKRMRRLGIVAVARKVLSVLWRFLETGVLAEGVDLQAVGGRDVGDSLLVGVRCSKVTWCRIMCIGSCGFHRKTRWRKLSALSRGSRRVRWPVSSAAASATSKNHTAR